MHSFIYNAMLTTSTAYEYVPQTCNDSYAFRNKQHSTEACIDQRLTSSLSALATALEGALEVVVSESASSLCRVCGS